MKISNPIVKYFFILSLIFTFIKPVSLFLNKQPLSTSQYTQTTECPTRAAINALCQASTYYTAEEQYLGCLPYLFIPIGLLFFAIPYLISTPPRESPFKPPI
ncbi:hypothetical protein [Legionella gresilensis]|uniref:hypothetical protein n=1 Tax=Legionella gresilensis TaxID=91823 RepID=UPI001041AE72|nr:hypothetical protein [Legionella gresilensis]